VRGEKGTYGDDEVVAVDCGGLGCHWADVEGGCREDDGHLWLRYWDIRD
jgi:hypothetical protein